MCLVILFNFGYICLHIFRIFNEKMALELYKEKNILMHIYIFLLLAKISEIYF